ncbi:MAG: hypothetical protein HRU51_08990 [Xanthomonadales bacterium]|nr:hypothetical protein [Xanthomonadales bacterium]
MAKASLDIRYSSCGKAFLARRGVLLLCMLTLTLGHAALAASGEEEHTVELPASQDAASDSTSAAAAPENDDKALSKEELALKLANPTAPIMTIVNNFDYIAYDGDLDGASDQSAFRFVNQTVLPFKMGGNRTLFFRPAIPVLFSEPVPSGNGFRSVGTDLGDIGFDLSYGATEKSGFLWALGIAGTLPTAPASRVGKDLWGLGPEVILGYIQKWGLVGGVLSHQWDMGGSGQGEIDITSFNYFYGFQLGGGWQIAAGPTISYDHTRDSSNRWTVPLGIGLSRTQVLGGRPWKFQLQYWNYVEKPDAFGPEHQLRLSINPVVTAPWNEGK